MLDATETAEASAPATGQAQEDVAMSRDLGLPVLTARYVEALNAFYRRRASLQFRFMGRGMRLAPTWLADEPDINEPYTITMKVDTDQAELVVSEGLLKFALMELDPALSLEKLDPETAAIIVEHALTEPLTLIEQAAGCQLSVITVSKGAGKWTGPDRPSLPMVLYVERMGIAWSLLRLSANDITRLSTVLDMNAGPARAAVDVPLELRVRVGAAAMSLAEIRSIEPGDIILADELARQPGGAVAVIGEHLVAPVEITPAGVRLAAKLRRGRGSPLEWSLNRQHGFHHRIENGGIGDVTVSVMFEAGHLELDLTAVQQLGPGAVLPLARAGRDASDLDVVVNGRVIGRGSLVLIGDSVGVRVSRLLGQHA
jgi:type III secretion protein Q